MKKKMSPLAGAADQLKEMLKKDPDCLLAPELRRAKQVEKTDPEEAKRIRKAFWDEADRLQKQKEKDNHDRRNRVGKYDPENIPLGKCRVCKTGDIVEKLKWESSHSTYRIGGPASPSYRVHVHFYCKGCGLVYAFAPNKQASLPDVSEDDFDEDEC